MNEPETQILVRGPRAYRNWRASQLSDASPEFGREHLLISDGILRLRGRVMRDFGPFELIQGVEALHVPDEHRGRTRPICVLRLTDFLGYQEKPSRSELKNETEYFGGGQEDEIAALLSLEWGIRLRALPSYREWLIEEDSIRQGLVAPEALDYALFSMPPLYHRLCVPRVAKRKACEIELTCRYGEISPKDAIALVRASNLYADAIWMAEHQPAVTWLLLISAMETAAEHEFRAEHTEPVEQLIEGKPETAKFLQGLNEDQRQECARLFGQVVGAGRKFRQFWKKYYPEPPEDRPLEDAKRVAWSRSKMGAALYKIYDYRSMALHGGIPFPVPMCWPPELSAIAHHSSELSEKPVDGTTFLGVGVADGHWRAKEIPMNLHTFEYFVRETLLNWWKALLEKNQMA